MFGAVFLFHSELVLIMFGAVVDSLVWTTYPAQPWFLRHSAIPIHKSVISSCSLIVGLIFIIIDAHYTTHHQIRHLLCLINYGPPLSSK